MQEVKREEEIKNKESADESDRDRKRQREAEIASKKRDLRLNFKNLTACKQQHRWKTNKVRKETQKEKLKVCCFVVGDFSALPVVADSHLLFYVHHKSFDYSIAVCMIATQIKTYKAYSEEGFTWMLVLIFNYN